MPKHGEARATGGPNTGHQADFRTAASASANSASSSSNCSWAIIACGGAGVTNAGDALQRDDIVELRLARAERRCQTNEVSHSAVARIGEPCVARARQHHAPADNTQLEGNALHARVHRLHQLFEVREIGAPVIAEEAGPAVLRAKVLAVAMKHRVILSDNGSAFAGMTHSAADFLAAAR